MSLEMKKSINIPWFDNANEMLEWLIAQWRETAKTTRGIVLLDGSDLRQIIRLYDNMGKKKLCRNKRPESKESRVSTNDFNL